TDNAIQRQARCSRESRASATAATASTIAGPPITAVLKCERYAALSSATLTATASHCRDVVNWLPIHRSAREKQDCANAFVKLAVDTVCVTTGTASATIAAITPVAGLHLSATTAKRPSATSPSATSAITRSSA